MFFPLLTWAEKVRQPFLDSTRTESGRINEFSHRESPMATWSSVQQMIKPLEENLEITLQALQRWTDLLVDL